MDRAQVSQQRILIVDDEEAILTVLKKSLAKVLPNAQVVTTTDSFTALGELLEHPFDVVVTDYNLGQVDGLELMEAVRYAQPDAQMIMITAFGTEILEEEAHRLQVFRYLTKPLKIDTFRQIVQQALKTHLNAPAHPIADLEAHYQQIEGLLHQLRSDTGARFTFLTDISGHLIARSGQEDDIPLETLSSLLGGGMATIVEAGRVLDQDTQAINLVYHEGQQDCLYTVNVGHHLILTLLIKRSKYSSRIGAVWYSIQQAAITLQERIQQNERIHHRDVFEEPIDRAFRSELDNLFSGNDL
ncbi:MAG: response regulator [Chloroflexota bacterium]